MAKCLYPSASISSLVTAQSSEGPCVSDTVRTSRKRERRTRKKRSFMIASLIEPDSESCSDHDASDEELPSKRPALCDRVCDKQNLNGPEILPSGNNTFQGVKYRHLELEKSESFDQNSSNTNHQRPNSLPLKSIERVPEVSVLNVEKVEEISTVVKTNKARYATLHEQDKSAAEKDNQNQSVNATQQLASLTIKRALSPVQSSIDSNSHYAPKTVSELNHPTKFQMPHPHIPSPLWPVFPVDERNQPKPDKSTLNSTGPHCFRTPADVHVGKNHYQTDNSPRTDNYQALFQPLPIRLFHPGASLNPYLNQGLHTFHVPNLQYHANKVNTETSERKGRFLNHFQTLIENTAMMNTQRHYQEAVSLASNHQGPRAPTINGSSSNAHCVGNVARHHYSPSRAFHNTGGPTFSPSGSDGISVASSSEPGLSPAPSASLSSPSSPRPHHLLSLSPRPFLVTDRSGSASVTMTTPMAPVSKTAKATALGINDNIHSCPPSRLGLRHEHMQLKMGRASGTGFVDGSKSFKAFLENANVKLEFINGGNGIKNPLLSTEFAENKIG
ncbi:hypothetical protein EGW08_001967, partial [Elysia chlorotica]